jgi:hypothetical protein
MTGEDPPQAPAPGSTGRHFRFRSVRRAQRRRRLWRIGAGIGSAIVVGAGTAAAIALNDGDRTAAPTPRSTTRPTVTVPTTAGTATATSTPARPCRAPLTTDAPLRLWIAGDSLAHSVGNGLGKRAANTGVVAPVYESRVSSGLGSPGFFDWPRRVTQEIPRLDPEIVVFVMGTNDWGVPQATPLDSSGQPAWRARYEQQVQAMVDALTADGRTLYWVAPPVLRDAAKEAGARQVADVVASVVARDSDAVFVDAHDLLDGDDGRYTATVEIGGRKVQVRTGDGVHLTNDGADYLGDAVFALIDRQCRVRAQAVEGARQPLVETAGGSSVTPSSTAPPAPDVPTTSSSSPPVSATSPSSSTTTTRPTSTTSPPTTTTSPPTTTATVATPPSAG